jgi:hypothetical protein
MSIDAKTLEEIDKARGMIPRSRWIENICKKAIAAPRPEPKRRDENEG